MSANENAAKGVKEDQRPIMIVDPKVEIGSLLSKFSDASKSKEIAGQQRKEIIEMLKVVGDMLNYINKLDTEMQAPYVDVLEQEIKMDKRTFISELYITMCELIITHHVVPSKKVIETYTKEMKDEKQLKDNRVFHSDFFSSCRTEKLLNRLNEAAPTENIELSPMLEKM